MPSYPHFQENITYLVRCGELNNEFQKGVYNVVSFLPLAHMAALLIDVYGPIYFAPTTYYADKDALKGTLINTLKEIRPNKFFAVPRVWEKMQGHGTTMFQSTDAILVQRMEIIK